MIIGSWKGNGEVLTFNKDKSLQIDDLHGKWSARGKVLTLEVNTRTGLVETVKRKFEVDEKTLHIEGRDGEMIFYKRKKDLENKINIV